MEFKGKVAVITGAGEGIGKAAALAFAREGAKIAVVDKNSESGRRTKEEIQRKDKQALFVKADVSKARHVQTMVEKVVQYFGRIDILVNNAGIQRYGTIEDTSEAQWDEVINVNLKSVFLCSKYCIPEIKKHKGVIINISSIQAFSSEKSVAAYAASKAAIIGLTHSMAVDLADKNIRVNAVCPASIDTPMLHQAVAQLKGEWAKEKMLSKIRKMHAQKRIGKPEEVAEVILFLASSKASFITGAAYLVDGGRMSML